jgi:hypothetical protein
MDTERIPLKTFLEGAAVVLVLEALVIGLWPHQWGWGMWVTGLLRVVQGGALVFILIQRGPGWSALGLARSDLRRGLLRGLLWSAGFGVLAGIGLVALQVLGMTPLKFFRLPLPLVWQRLLVLFLIGGLVGPVVEELFFRGLIFGYLRRWGAAAAIVGSTLVFLAPHVAYRSLGPTQVVGGLIFAVAYEIEGSLLVPILIHVLGNLALFGLGLVG